MNKKFLKATGAIPKLFRELSKSEPFTAKGVATQRKRPGVYVFYEKGVPVHVGRTRNLASRLRGHITKNHFTASFAFKRTRRLMNLKATYKPKGSRAALAKDKVFGPKFHKQIELVRSMTVRFIEVPDPVAQYLLELYAHPRNQKSPLGQ